MDGENPYHPPTTFISVHVMPKAGHQESRYSILLPPGVDELIVAKFPDCLAAEGEKISEDCWRMTVLDLDYSYSVWLAVYSLAGRWSLNPVDANAYIGDQNLQYWSNR